MTLAVSRIVASIRAGRTVDAGEAFEREDEKLADLESRTNDLAEELDRAREAEERQRAAVDRAYDAWANSEITDEDDEAYELSFHSEYSVEHYG
jgi:hypothetical protein